MLRIFIVGALVMLMMGCAPRPIEVVDLELRDLDTLFVEAPKPNALKKASDYRLPRYNPTYERKHDLLHVALDLSFNWEEEAVLGKASLDLQPHFYSSNQVSLDAKGFEIHKVSLGSQKLDYNYDGRRLVIQLGRTYQAGEKYTLQIDYTARPASNGGSAAITSDQGLFFVNPRGEDGDKPQQIWTQGETEWNSRWFPCIDKPNERCTQEFRITVADRFKTLSNGVLASSTQNDDGTRTDYWKMEQAHAPYLFMLAIGEFAVVKDMWNDIPVEYYVEPAYKESARAIFNHTPEMIQFFSDKLDYPFPWPKYAQVVVRDYVSGAMENTSAVIFGDFVQKHKRALIDNHNDGIVAHELFHHWFGDLVTCESWANLTMNEGFANYSEYLWYEHKYGKDEAAYHMLSERRNYFYSAQRDAHPLIYFGFRDKEDMFDAHSYNKGGSVLHMLRSLLGEEAFWAGLNSFLKANAYKAVEAHHLRLAFEQVTGKDLNWFFNQWYFASGHPELKINYDYDEKSGTALVEVEQIQSPDKYPPIFQFPAYVDLYIGGEKRREEVWMDRRQQTFSFTTSQAPDLITFDADYTLLNEFSDNKTEENYVFQFKHAPHFMDRYLAMEFLMEKESSRLQEVLPLAMKDPHWYIRRLAIDNQTSDIPESVLPQLAKMLQEDPNSKVRAAALVTLDRANSSELLDLAKQVIDQDSAYNVIGNAIQVIYRIDKKMAADYVSKLENVESESIRLSIAQLYAEQEDLSKLKFFEDNLEKVNGYNASSFYGHYQTLLTVANSEQAMSASKKLKDIGVNQGQSAWRRFAAAKSIVDLANGWQAKANRTKNDAEKVKLNKQVDQLAKYLKEIKANEQNDQMKAMYRQVVIIERN